MQRTLGALLWFACLVLAGCATVQESGVKGPDEIERSGRFAFVIKDEQRPDESLQGRFYWLDTQQTLRLDLSSPIGVTLARVNVAPDLAVLFIPGEPAIEARSADELFIKVFAEPIPIRAIRDWIQGRLSASLHATQVQRDSAFRVSSFKAGQWHVELSRYDEQGPNLIAMTQVSGTRTVSLKLVVDGQP